MFSFGGVEMISLRSGGEDRHLSVATSVKAMIWRLSTFYVVSMATVPGALADCRTELGLTESPFVLVFSELSTAADVI